MLGNRESICHGCGRNRLVWRRDCLRGSVVMDRDDRQRADDRGTSDAEEEPVAGGGTGCLLFVAHREIPFVRRRNSVTACIEDREGVTAVMKSILASNDIGSTMLKIRITPQTLGGCGHETL